MSRPIFIAVLGLLIALPAVAITIRSKISAAVDTGGNTGQGNIVTGDASATSGSTIISSGGDTDVKASATAEANGKKSGVSVEAKPDGGDISIEKSESTDSTQASVEVNVSPDDGSDAPKEEGIFERIVSKVASFLRSLFR